MKNKHTRISLISLLVFFFAFFSLPNLALAKVVNMYDIPKDGAKVVGTIDAAKGMVPIFSQPDGSWMKVGDPQNGNVGWIKSQDVAPSNSISFSQQIMNDSKGTPYSSQIVRFGNTNPPQNENQNLQNYLKQRNNNVPQNANQAIQKVVNDINSFYLKQFNQIPVVVPVVVMPGANNSNNNPTNK